MKKQTMYIIAAIVAVFIFTNPGHQDFRSYLHFAPTFYLGRTGRDFNFIIGSIYSYNGIHYLGILGNFIKL